MVMAGFRNYEGQTKTLSRRENNYQLLYSLIGRSRSFGKEREEGSQGNEVSLYRRDSGSGIDKPVG